jgi:hypothetical protein
LACAYAPPTATAAIAKATNCFFMDILLCEAKNAQARILRTRCRK